MTLTRNIPEAAMGRLYELQNDSANIQKALQIQEQLGTAIPQLFGSSDSLLVNPSNVGTGVLARMIETDDAVGTAVQFMALMIQAKIGPYHHENQEISEDVNDWLSKLKYPTWSESIEAMLSSKAFGFSVTEIVYALSKDMKKTPVHLATYHPSTIAFEVDPAGRITEEGVIQFIQQYTQFSNPNSYRSKIHYGFTVKNPFTTPTDHLLPQRMQYIQSYGTVRIPRNKCIHLTNLPLMSFGSPYGKTSVRTAHIAWQLKNFFFKQLGIAGKRNSTNTLWATAPGGVNKVSYEDPVTKKAVMLTPIEALQKLLGDRETDDAITTPPESSGYKVTSLQNQANLDQYINVLNNLDVRIFRAFLIPSLVMTDGSAGNRALGDKHFQIVDRVCESDADKFGRAIVNDMIQRYILENYGRQDDYGKFTQRPQSIEERERLANMFSTLTTSGIAKPHVKSDMAFMRASLSMPDDQDKSFEVEDQEGKGDENDQVD